ncbi:MAG: HupE/UreJ family protein [Planctomycetota bacterium]
MSRFGRADARGIGSPPVGRFNGLLGAALLGLVLLAPALAAAGPPAAHPDSLSSSRIEVRASGLLVRLRLQTLSILEVLPDADESGDGRLSDAELGRVRPALVAYVQAHYRVGTDSDRTLEVGRWLALDDLDLRAVPEDELADAGPGALAGAVDLTFEHLWGAERSEGTGRAAPRDLVVECSLFEATSPGHTDLCMVAWPGGAVRHLTLGAGHPRGRSDPSGRGTLGAFLRLGADHVLGGFDHLAFVLALLLGARGLRSLLGLVTAFTAAHSVTLVASSLGGLSVGRHAPLIEAAIALSIAWVAFCLALDPDPKRGRWPEAFALGLVHGLGFAGFLRDSLLLEEARLRALVGFNLGVEVGQVLFVTVAALLLRALARGRDGYLAARPVRRFGAIAIGGLALWWFFERI